LTLKTIKRLAAQILKVGERRVRIDPEQYDKVSSAITKEDVRRLINDGVITVKQKKGISKGRKRMVQRQKRRGLRRGAGSRKGHRALKAKDAWIKRVRALREFLVELRKRRIITKNTYRKLYLMVKSNVFKSRAQLKSYISEKKLGRTPV